MNEFSPKPLLDLPHDVREAAGIYVLNTCIEPATLSAMYDERVAQNMGHEMSALEARMGFRIGSVMDVAERFPSAGVFAADLEAELTDVVPDYRPNMFTVHVDFPMEIVSRFHRDYDSRVTFASSRDPSWYLVDPDDPEYYSTLPIDQFKDGKYIYQPGEKIRKEHVYEAPLGPAVFNSSAVHAQQPNARNREGCEPRIVASFRQRQEPYPLPRGPRQLRMFWGWADARQSSTIDKR